MSGPSLSERMRPPSCRLKNHYPTEKMAERARVRQQEKWGWLLRVYECRHCDEFHLSQVKVDGKAVPILGWVDSGEESRGRDLL